MSAKNARTSALIYRCTFFVPQGSFTDFLSLFQGEKFIGSFSQSARSSQTIFIRIIYTSQIRETVGSEAFFAFLENHIPSFLINKNWEFTVLSCEFPILAGAQGLEP